LSSTYILHEQNNAPKALHIYDKIELVRYKKVPRNLFGNITILMMHFISFCIVKETVLLGGKKLTQLSEIEKIKCILNPTDCRQLQFLGSFQCNGTEGSLLTGKQTSSLNLLYFLICLLYFLSEAVLLAYVTIQLID
jgi:hypothetical protein